MALSCGPWALGVGYFLGLFEQAVSGLFALLAAHGRTAFWPVACLQRENHITVDGIEFHR